MYEPRRARSSRSGAVTELSSSTEPSTVSPTIAMTSASKSLIMSTTRRM
jgi:hypothetical protein